MAIREPGIVKSIKGVSADRRNTEAGLTKAQRETLERVEKEAAIRNGEVLRIIDENGKVTGMYIGNQNSVSIPTSEEYKLRDAVVTHNHPGYFTTSLWGNTLATRVGQSLSAGDIIASVKHDSKEIRAVTKGGYIYSLKRPAKGWGIDTSVPGWEERFNDVFTRVENKYDRQYRYRYPDSMVGKVDTADGARMKILARHNAVKELAEKYGWKYTRRRWTN